MATFLKEKKYKDQIKISWFLYVNDHVQTDEWHNEISAICVLNLIAAHGTDNQNYWMVIYIFSQFPNLAEKKISDILDINIYYFSPNSSQIMQGLLRVIINKNNNIWKKIFFFTWFLTAENYM